MHRQPHSRIDVRPRRILARLVGAVCLCLACGCQSFGYRDHDGLTLHPAEVPRRSIEELFFEALDASSRNPENTVLPITQSPQMLIGPGYPGATPHPAPPSAIPEPRASSRPTGQPIRLTSGEAGLRFVADAAGPQVSEVFADTDVRDAIQILADQARVSVIMDEQVGGLTSALIENEPFEAALEKLLLPLGLVYKREGDRYLIGSDSPSSPLFSRIAESYEYRPLHLSPEELVLLLPERQQIYVRAVDKRNLMIVEAPRDTAHTIVARLQEFDQPVPQVILEAIVCVITPESGFRSGIDWGHALRLNGRDLLNVGLTGLAFSGQVTPLGLDEWNNDFAVTSAFVRLLAQEGYLSIRAAPRVMAKDGEEASISIARETFFSTQPQNSDFIFRQDIERVEAGIALDITPIVRGENITVIIDKAEVSEDIRSREINREINQNPFPLINRRTVSTTVTVRDGETIVIGGLVTRQTVDRVSRIPVLGRIPVVGKLFEIVEKAEQDAEVVIFISPRLVHPTGSPRQAPFPPAGSGGQLLPLHKHTPVPFLAPPPAPAVPGPPSPGPDLTPTAQWIVPTSGSRIESDRTRPSRLPPPRRVAQ